MLSSSTDNFTEAILDLADCGGKAFVRFYDGHSYQEISGAEFVQRAQSCASWLHKKGVEPSQSVAIISSATPGAVTAFAGSILAGAIPFFLSPLTAKQDVSYFRRTLSDLIAKTDKTIILCSAESTSEVSNLADRIFAIEEINFVSDISSTAVKKPQPDQTAFAQYSSGTTGLRKRMEFSHQRIMKHAEAFQHCFKYDTQTDHIVSWLPLYHDMGFNRLLDHAHHHWDISDDDRSGAMVPKTATSLPSYRRFWGNEMFFTQFRFPTPVLRN